MYMKSQEKWSMWNVIVATRRVTMRTSVQAQGQQRLFKVRKVKEPVPEKTAEEPKSLHQIYVCFSDLTAEDNYPFIRYWIKFYGNRRSEDRTESDGIEVRIFVDIGANVNIMSRRQFVSFLDVNLDLDYRRCIWRLRSQVGGW